MTNAKIEFIEHIKDREVECAIIQQDDWVYDDPKTFVLPPGYTDLQFKEFLHELTKWDYNSGYGTQELLGTIWYTDGTWSSRGEYDGSEWWEHQKRPDFQTTLDKLQKDS